MYFIIFFLHLLRLFVLLTVGWLDNSKGTTVDRFSGKLAETQNLERGAADSTLGSIQIVFQIQEFKKEKEKII